MKIIIKVATCGWFIDWGEAWKPLHSEGNILYLERNVSCRYMGLSMFIFTGQVTQEADWDEDELMGAEGTADPTAALHQ